MVTEMCAQIYEEATWYKLILIPKISEIDIKYMEDALKQQSFLETVRLGIGTFF